MFNTDYLGLHSINNAILDVLLGEEVHFIPRSLTMHTVGMLASEGLESAAREYASVLDRGSEGYLPESSDFSFNYIAERLLENGESKHAINVLELGLRLNPDSDTLRSMLEQLMSR